MAIVNVLHKTVYRYATPVYVGEHNMMIRPRPSKHLTVLNQDLFISPNAVVTANYDKFGNLVEKVNFDNYQTTELSFLSSFTVDHNPRTHSEIASQVWKGCRLPRPIGHSNSSYYADPTRTVEEWVSDFLNEHKGELAFDVLCSLNQYIGEEFRYVARYTMDTQSPKDTIAKGTGTCRDFAALMVESSRVMGFPSQFVSGYLYDDAIIEDDNQDLVGGGNTHAWAQVHLPGAGWIEFDPTNNLVGGKNLIASAVIPDHTHVCPIWGSYTGRASDFIGMEVGVKALAETQYNRNPQVQEIQDDYAVMRI
jgi:transglutaminase-like putative cysteine protease